MKPKAKWNGVGVKSITGLYWWSQSRDRYIIEARETKYPNKVLVCIFDNKDNDKLIHTIELPITDGAIIKPDIIDFELWEREAEEYLDKLQKSKEKK